MAELLQHVINGIAAGTIYALVALGYTMVYGVLKLINFAHGDVMMVGVFIGFTTAMQLGQKQAASFFGVTLVFLLSMGLCALLGLLIERFAYRPLREKPRLTALITAIGISFTLSYGFQLELVLNKGGPRPFVLLPGASPRAFPEVIAPTEWLHLIRYAHGGIDVGLGAPPELHLPEGVPPPETVILWNWQVISLLIAAALMVGLQLLVFKTRFGRAMRAVSFDHRVAALMGVPVDRIIAGTFMLGSALAAGAGLLYAIKDTKIEPLMGLYVGLKAFVAAVIGGIGHVPGAVAGALLLGLCEEFLVGYGAAIGFGSTWRDAVAFGFLILVLLLRPEGLFGRASAEKV